MSAIPPGGLGNSGVSPQQQNTGQQGAYQEELVIQIGRDTIVIDFKDILKNWLGNR